MANFAYVSESSQDWEVFDLNESSAWSADEELEVLQSIYLDDLTVTKSASCHPISVSISLRPSIADKAHLQFVCLVLKIDLAPSYPETHPRMSIKQSRGLSDKSLQNIVDGLNLLANELRGECMLYRLIEYVRDQLTENNIPECCCAICLESFCDEDKFIRTECYHYFHSYCLINYIDYTMEVHKNELLNSKTNEITVIENSDVLCPMCREVISYNEDELRAAPPPIQQSPDQDFCQNKYQEELKNLRLLYIKQQKQGGIIDLECEQSKFVIPNASTADSDPSAMPTSGPLFERTSPIKSHENDSSFINGDKLAVHGYSNSPLNSSELKCNDLKNRIHEILMSSEPTLTIAKDRSEENVPSDGAECHSNDSFIKTFGDKLICDKDYCDNTKATSDYTREIITHTDSEVCQRLSLLPNASICETDKRLSEDDPTVSRMHAMPSCTEDSDDYASDNTRNRQDHQRSSKVETQRKQRRQISCNNIGVSHEHAVSHCNTKRKDPRTSDYNTSGRQDKMISQQQRTRKYGSDRRQPHRTNNYVADGRHQQTNHNYDSDRREPHRTNNYVAEGRQQQTNHNYDSDRRQPHRTNNYVPEGRQQQTNHNHDSDRREPHRTNNYVTEARQQQTNHNYDSDRRQPHITDKYVADGRQRQRTDICATDKRKKEIMYNDGIDRKQPQRINYSVTDDGQRKRNDINGTAKLQGQRIGIYDNSTDRIHANRNNKYGIDRCPQENNNYGTNKKQQRATNKSTERINLQGRSNSGFNDIEHRVSSDCDINGKQQQRTKSYDNNSKQQQRTGTYTAYGTQRQKSSYLGTGDKQNQNGLTDEVQKQKTKNYSSGGKEQKISRNFRTYTEKQVNNKNLSTTSHEMQYETCREDNDTGSMCSQRTKSNKPHYQYYENKPPYRYRYSNRFQSITKSNNADSRLGKNETVIFTDSSIDNVEVARKQGSTTVNSNRWHLQETRYYNNKCKQDKIQYYSSDATSNYETGERCKNLKDKQLLPDCLSEAPIDQFYDTPGDQEDEMPKDSVIDHKQKHAINSFTTEGINSKQSESRPVEANEFELIQELNSEPGQSEGYDPRANKTLGYVYELPDKLQFENQDKSLQQKKSCSYNSEYGKCKQTNEQLTELVYEKHTNRVLGESGQSERINGSDPEPRQRKEIPTDMTEPGQREQNKMCDVELRQKHQIQNRTTMSGDEDDCMESRTKDDKSVASSSTNITQTGGPYHTKARDRTEHWPSRKCGRSNGAYCEPPWHNYNHKKVNCSTSRNVRNKYKDLYPEYVQCFDSKSSLQSEKDSGNPSQKQNYKCNHRQMKNTDDYGMCTEVKGYHRDTSMLKPNTYRDQTSISRFYSSYQRHSNLCFTH